MNKTLISLEFDKTISSLAGNKYGVSVYEKQVKEKFDWAGQNTIMFPDHINDIAISFVQGFFSDIIEKIGLNGFKRQVEIISIHKDLVNKILKSI